MSRPTHRELLLDGARQCLEEKGYARTTARDLVAASGTNLASIGYHFGSKEALLNEAIGQAFDEWTQEVGEIAMSVPEASALDRMAASWVALLDSFERNRMVLVAFVEALAQAERSPELRDQLAGHYQRNRERIAEMVRATIGDAGDDPAVAERVASFLIAVCDGFVLQYLLDPERTPTGEELVDALGAALEAALSATPS
jgi:AcrR family transcriptional regulator